MKLLPPPGPARTRQLVLLSLLLVAAAFALSRYFGGVPAVTSSAASNPQTRATTPLGSPATMPQPLKLERLEPVAEPPETSRNPFRFGAPPAPAAPPPTYRPPPAAPAVPGAAAVPQVPRIPLTFIGRVVLPGREVVAVLADDRGSRYEATEGQIVDGRYRVVRIGEESLVIEHVNGTGRATLQLKGS
jgi:hypothetical protein